MPQDEPSKHGLPWTDYLATGLIVLAALAAYGNSFSGPFICDDEESIPDNPTIRCLWPVWQAISPPRDGQTVDGRPLLNLSFAVNYAIHGENTWGYHATNLAIHIFNGLLLLGILRRTFLLPALRPRFGNAASGLALAISLLWTVHPLQTESVTYIVQRAESLAGLFYLLTLYSVIRGTQCERAVFWYVVAIAACFLGSATKEIVVTAPLVVMLYDRTFVEGSFRGVLRRRWGLYVGLAASWGLTIGLLWSKAHAGHLHHAEGFDAWSYLRSQPGVILYYLWLSLWPHPLCISYEWPAAKTLSSILPPMLVVGFLLAATVRGVLRRTEVGFLSAWFFLILTPSSSFLPLGQLAFEHRMYLPLAGVVTLVVISGYLVGQEAVRRGWIGGRTGLAGGIGWVVLTATMLGLATFHRNEAYRSALSIWLDTVMNAPVNPFAHNDLGLELVKAGRTTEAFDHFEQAARIQPDLAAAHINWGHALTSLGRPLEAIEHYRQAARIKPNSTEAQYNWANALLSLNREAEAIEHYEQAVRITPTFAEAHNNLASALAAVGRFEESLEHYRQSLRLKPDYAEGHNNIAFLLMKMDRLDEAVEHYRQALHLQPDYLSARLNLASILLKTGQLREAIDQGKQAVRHTPDQPSVNRFVAWLLATHDVSQGGDPSQAVSMAERACLMTARKDIACLDTLAAAYASADRFDEAVAVAKEAWKLAKSAGQKAAAEEIHMRLQLYRNGKPYRRPAQASNPTRYSGTGVIFSIRPGVLDWMDGHYFTRVDGVTPGGVHGLPRGTASGRPPRQIFS